MGCRIPYHVGAVAGVHTLNGSFPHQNVVFFSPFQHFSVWIPMHNHTGTVAVRRQVYASKKALLIPKGVQEHHVACPPH